MTLRYITEQDEIKVGDVLIHRSPFTGQEWPVTVTKVTKTRILTNTGSAFTKDGCNPHEKLTSFRHRLFKAV